MKRGLSTAPAVEPQEARRAPAPAQQDEAQLRAKDCQETANPEGDGTGTGEHGSESEVFMQDGHQSNTDGGPETAQEGGEELLGSLANSILGPLLAFAETLLPQMDSVSGEQRRLASCDQEHETPSEEAIIKPKLICKSEEQMNKAEAEPVIEEQPAVQDGATCCEYCGEVLPTSTERDKQSSWNCECDGARARKIAAKHVHMVAALLASPECSPKGQRRARHEKRRAKKNASLYLSEPPAPSEQHMYQESPKNGVACPSPNARSAPGSGHGSPREPGRTECIWPQPRSPPSTTWHRNTIEPSTKEVQDRASLWLNWHQLSRTQLSQD